MACIEHYTRDAENIFEDIEARVKKIQSNASVEYIAARTIQRWFRGYITRKHITRLNNCATTIQSYWRGYVDRNLYYKLLQEAVHKMYLEHYNLMATKIQKVWRGHYVRTHVFSYYKLKAYINRILQKNKEVLELAKEYERETDEEIERKKQQKCQEQLAYISFKIHHLIRTQQIEGIYSKHGTIQYSAIENHLKSIKCLDYIKAKKAKEKQKELSKHDQNYIFEGKLRECEEAWLHRNEPGKYGLSTGEYGLDAKLNLEQQKINDALMILQNKPMKFGPVRYKAESKLNTKQYQCPPLHRNSAVKALNHKQLFQTSNVTKTNQNNPIIGKERGRVET